MRNSRVINLPRGWRFLSVLVLAAGAIAHPLLEGSELPYGYPDTQRTKVRINDQWRFQLGDPEASLFQQELDDSAWEAVTVPHTLKLTSLWLDNVRDEKTQLVFHRHVGWYRRDILIGPDRGQRVFLEFEGAHQVTDLWVNGEHVGHHAVGGYTPFHFDITDYVRFDESNQVTLRLDNRRRDDCPPDPGPFDYIKFGGLYRDVYLVQTDPLRIQFNWEGRESGITVTTPSVDVLNGNATVNIKTGVFNGRNQPVSCQLVTRVIDKQGVVVLKLVSLETIDPGREFVFNQIGGIEENLHLWDLDNPYLYRVNAMLVVNKDPVDVVETRIGFRTFTLDQEQGFLLNGKPVELIGMNRHQHYGYIGDAVPDSLHYRDMLQFKELGFNIVRTAHYPQDNALLEACDELGILAYEEAPTWIDIGNEAWFDNLEKAARTMVRNHRNHPSIVIWGAGINHRGYVPRLHYAIKQEDPFRLTASQSSRWTGWQASGLTDIFGNMLYGPVEWDRQEPLLAMEGRRGYREVAKYKRDPKLTGLISWTAHAYYTFHEAWEWQPNKDRTRSGVMTVFREPKAKLMWYQSELTRTPMVHIESQWDGESEVLEVYSNCDKIEVFVNGDSRGIYLPSDDPDFNGLDHPPFLIERLSFVPGELSVKGFIGASAVASDTVHTPLEPAAVRLDFATSGPDWVADGSDIVVGHAYVVDANGTVIRDYTGNVVFSISGEGEIIGDGADIGANPFLTDNGAAPVLIRSSDTAGSAVVTASVKGLRAGSFRLESTPAETDMIRSRAGMIHDPERQRVDMGAMGQLVQFDWLPWNGSDMEMESLELPHPYGARVSIRPASEKGILRWLGEMNVIGKNGYVYGEGVLGVDREGMVLRFDGLPAGKYMLKTYHHAPRSNTDSMDPNRENLKTLDILSIPYAKVILVESGASRDEVNITLGQNMQYDDPATAVTELDTDGQSPVVVEFKDAADGQAIWLNGFEISREN